MLVAPRSPAAGLAADLRRLLADDVIVPDAPDHATDYGRVVWRTPAVVARPRSAEDVAAVVAYARRHGVRVGTRGAAHSQGGQSLCDGGILLDLRALRGVVAVDESEEWVEAHAGTEWRDVVAATLARGLAPPVLTTNLRTTIGGTHSVGGVGAASFRHGAQIDNCLALEIATGAGEVVECSVDRHRELFQHALGGLGRLGVLTRVRHRALRHPATVHVQRLAYRDRSRALADARRLAAIGAVIGLHLDTIAAPRGWLHLLRVASTVEDPMPDDGLPLGHVQLLYRRGLPYAAWAVANQDEPGTVGAAPARPGFDVVLAPGAAAAFAAELLAELPRLMRAQVAVLTLPLERRRLGRPLFALPDGDETSLELLSVIPDVPPEALPGVLPALERLLDRARTLGGVRYLPGWLPPGFDWATHHGAARWATLARLRGEHDPDGVLAAGLADVGQGSSAGPIAPK